VQPFHVLVLIVVLSSAAVPARAKETPSSFTGRPQAMVVIHGVGNQKEGDYEKFKDMVRAEFEGEVFRLTGIRPAHDALRMKTARWSDITQKDQELFNQRFVERYGKGKLPTLRRLMVSMGGDALSYSREKEQLVKDRVKEAVQMVSQKVQSVAPTRQGDLTVVAHSWGTVAGSDALWDMTNQRGQPFPQNLRLRHLVTLGGPLAVVAQRVGLDKLDSPVQPERWTNIWYEKDFIGHPLGILGPSYSSIVKDVPLRSARHYNRFWSPFCRLLSKLPSFGAVSHTMYWRDPRVVRRIAKRMARQYTEGMPARPAKAPLIRRGSRGRPRPAPLP